MALRITHTRVALKPISPTADITTGDWNDDHTIEGVLSEENLPAFSLPDFANYFVSGDPAGVPSAVTNLEGHAGFTEVILSWDLSSAALWRTYEIYEGATSGFTPGTPILTTPTTVVAIPHDAGAGPFYYKIRAKNSRGESSTDVQVGPFTLLTVPAVSIGPGSILAENLAQNAVDLASNVVTGTLGTVKIADGAITADKVAAGAIIAAKIGAGAVTANAIYAGSITAQKIAAGAIVSSHIGADEILASHIAAGQILAEHLTAGCVTAASIAAGTITAESACIANIDIGNAKVIGTLRANQIAAGVISAAKITTGTMSADRIDGGDINGVTITGVVITGARIATDVPGATRWEMNSSGWQANQMNGFTGDERETLPGHVKVLAGYYWNPGGGRGVGEGAALSLASPDIGLPGGRAAVIVQSTFEGPIIEVFGVLSPHNGIKPLPVEAWTQVSDDGIWIQDADVPERLWKLFMKDNKLYARWGPAGSAYHIVG